MRLITGLCTLFTVLVFLHCASMPGPGQGPFWNEEPDFSRWIETRALNSNDGKREYVRIPLAYRSIEWCFRCPDVYAGADPKSHNGDDTWLFVTYAKGLFAPASSAEGHIIIAEGYFTGERKIHEKDVSMVAESVYGYNLWCFHVLSMKRYIPQKDFGRVCVIRKQ